MSLQDERIPTEVSDAYWVYARNNDQAAGRDSSKVGKWMLFVNKNEKVEGNKPLLDLHWSKIAALVRSGEIFSAKCSTNLKNPNEKVVSSKNPNGVIICYTRDYNDITDVKRVADLIRQHVEYKQPIYYKTDEATLAGVYQATSGKRVSMYRHLQNGEMYRSQGSNWILINHA